MSLRWQLLVLIGLLVLIALCSSVQSQPDQPEDDIAFFSRLDNRTEVVYMGEYSICLDVYFAHNYTNWEVACESELFAHNLSGRNMRWNEGGHWHGHGIQLDRNQEPGVYPIPVYLNYTDDNGTLVRKVFDLQLTCIRVVELIDFWASGGELHLSLELHAHCDDLWVRFDTDGGLRVSPESHRRADVEPGRYEFTSDVTSGWNMVGDEDEVAYHIIAEIDGRTVEYARYNIPPSEVMEGNYSGPIILAVGLVALAVLLVFLFVRWRRVQPGGDRPEDR